MERNRPLYVFSYIEGKLDSSHKCRKMRHMRVRHICEVVEGSGKTPVSDWIEKKMTTRERAKLHTRLIRIENEAVVTVKWLKPYNSLKMVEIRFGENNKAFRFLCEQIGSQIVMLVGTQKNEHITPQEEQRAVRLRDAIVRKAASVRSYPIPSRT